LQNGKPQNGMIEGSFYLFENPRNLTPDCQMKRDDTMSFIRNVAFWCLFKITNYRELKLKK
jgi:hypothetical protein